MKSCVKCKQLYPLSDYWSNPRASDKKQYRCKWCLLKAQKLWGDKNKEYRRQYGIEYEKKRGKRPRSQNELNGWGRLKRQYNLSKEQYLNICKQQSGACAICKEPKKLYVDHDHDTGKVRGLLCQHCNSMLGFAKDSLQTLKSGIKYIKTRTFRETK